jgi:hypothetical protein
MVMVLAPVKPKAKPAEATAPAEAPAPDDTPGPTDPPAQDAVPDAAAEEATSS